MRKSVYFCMVFLLCLCLLGCDGESPEKTVTTENASIEITDIVTVSFFPETTAVPVETTVETTAETTAVTTTATTAAVTTKAVTTETTTATEPPAPENNKFMPSVLSGEYTYNDGSAPVIEVVNGFTYVGGILIVNKTYSLPETYDPGRLHPDAQAAFEKMQAAAAAEGLKLKIISGFRPYSQQYSTYNNYAARDGKELADRYSARPGHSEHQTGLAMDINSLRQSFANTAEGKWLAAHCAEYGFIIRYGADKEPQTGFMYEPWHIRYLGVELAKAVTDSGLCLEEYLGITSVYAE